MSGDRTVLLLRQIREQAYPLTLQPCHAEAIVECFREIMTQVPEDDHALVRFWYDEATSALLHPPCADNTNQPTNP